MAGHAQLKFVMTECSKTQIRRGSFGLQNSAELPKTVTHGMHHWHLVNGRLNSYIDFKNKIRFSQNKLNKRDMVRQNTFSYITESFSQLELYQIQETGRALFKYNIINTSKTPDKVFQIIHSTEKIWINFPFCPFSCLGENKSHPWLPVREATHENM